MEVTCYQEDKRRMSSVLEMLLIELNHLFLVRTMSIAERYKISFDYGTHE